MSTQQQELTSWNGLDLSQEPRPTEMECPECRKQITIGPSGIEYGHALTADDSRHVENRCPRRPDCVDPIRGGQR